MQRSKERQRYSSIKEWYNRKPGGPEFVEEALKDWINGLSDIELTVRGTSRFVDRFRSRRSTRAE